MVAMALLVIAFALIFTQPLAAVLAQSGTPRFTPGNGSLQRNQAGPGSVEVLPGGFRRFNDSSGNTGSLQRTPGSGFPNSQFIAPVPSMLPPSTATEPTQSPSTALPPPPSSIQNFRTLPGTQIPIASGIPGQNR